MIHASYIDVLLVSARMEEEPRRGILLLRQLRAECHGLKAVVLLDSSKPGEVVDAFRAGACGVFCRSTEIQLLRKCIAAVHRGQIWANSEELSFILAALASLQPIQFDSKRLTPLSAREKDVVRCLVEGLTNSEIAKTLEISQHTVKNYLFKIFDKLGVANRVELVFRVLSAPDRLGLAPANSVSETVQTPAPGLARVSESASALNLPIPIRSESKSGVLMQSSSEGTMMSKVVG
jgi:DNA-binding NarL/FixJ family response regulator